MAPSIPHELVLDILDALLSDDTPTQSARDALRACSLVSRSWSTPAQTRLFRSVHLEAPPATLTVSTTPTPRTPIERFKILLAAITPSTAHAQTLAHSIRSLTLLEVVTFGEPSRYPAKRVSAASFAQFLSICPSIHSLSIKSGLLCFPSSVSTPLALSKIRDLHLFQERPTHRSKIDTLFRQGAFDGVRKLSWTLHEGDDHSNAFAHPHLYPIPSSSDASESPETIKAAPASLPEYGLPPLSSNSLTSLTLDFRASGPSLGLLCTLLDGSRDSLRELNLPHIAPEPLALPIILPSEDGDVEGKEITCLKDVLLEFAPRVESLGIGAVPSTWVEGSFPLGPNSPQGQNTLSSVGEDGVLDLSALKELKNLTLLSTRAPMVRLAAPSRTASSPSADATAEGRVLDRFEVKPVDGSCSPSSSVIDAHVKGLGVKVANVVADGLCSFLSHPFLLASMLTTSALSFLVT